MTRETNRGRVEGKGWSVKAKLWIEAAASSVGSPGSCIRGLARSGLATLEDLLQPLRVHDPLQEGPR